MPKFFTIKDFITYNNPCFNCSKNIKIDLGYQHTYSTSGYAKNIEATTECLVFELKVGYFDYLSLKIYYKDNSIETNNPPLFQDYIRDKKLYLRSFCSYCHTEIISDYLLVNLEKGRIDPLQLKNERLLINDTAALYYISSDYSANTSVLVADRIDKTNPLSPTKLTDLPILPLYTFKNKEHLLKKIRTWLTFS